MKLWKRATGVLKDKTSLWIAKLSRKTPYRNPILEAAIIKATSHDEDHLDYKNLQRVFQWVRANPLHLKPLAWALAVRMEKTRNWVVALKGLMLYHGVLCCDIPKVQGVGKLPFDLSNFSDGHSRSETTWGFTVFVRAYFAYLDQRSAFVASEVRKHSKKIRQGKLKVEDTLMEELERLQKMQGLIDMLLQIRPQNQKMECSGLMLEAMDCVIVEAFDLYGKIYKAIERVLLKIYHVGGKMEASIALKVLKKAALQGDELSSYFEYCRDLGVLNASRCPKIEQIPGEDIRDLERIINNGATQKKDHSDNDDDEKKRFVERDNNTIIATIDKQSESQEKWLKTVITDKWEVFEEDCLVDAKEFPSNGLKIAASTNPFDDLYSLITYPPPPPPAACSQVLPDLISFY
ncbi:hypothetical protein L6164_001346 [Bauhinia variegata]|uniref:Uncharacterized protein n=1 Tax=Bauhinia variegata TaxID=167791 RepID=A0ACB9Q9D8_BAUVA|nr:hypothetical protein L6164_001346 [Bauhinia variegata]